MYKSKTREYVFFIFIVFIASILFAVFAGIVSFAFSFILFGDGSNLYFWLQKTLHIEPYVFLAVSLSSIVFFATWAVGFALLKSRKLKLH